MDLDWSSLVSALIGGGIALVGIVVSEWRRDVRTTTRVTCVLAALVLAQSS
jgi:hypothetical protein